MAGTLQLAWRNLGRNRRRTVITGLALAAGIGLCIATYGHLDGVQRDMLHSLTRLDLGHLQLHHPGHRQGATLRSGVPDPRRIAAIARARPGVIGAAPRVYGFGLASRQRKSLGVQLVGVDPRHERLVTDLHLALETGRDLDLQPTRWPRGRALSGAEQRQDARLTAQAERAVLDEIERLGASGRDQETGAAPRGRDQETGAPRGRDQQTKAAPRVRDQEARRLTERLARDLDPPPPRPPRVVVGAALAKLLAARPGSRVTLLTNTQDGSASEVQVEVGGVFRTGSDAYDRARVYLHLQDLQRLLHLDGVVHEIAVRLARPEDARAAVAQLQRLAPAAGCRSWDQLRPDIGSLLKQDALPRLLVSIVLVLAGLGVVNAMLLSILERTRELGMLKALGMSGWRIVQLVFAETGLLVLVAALGGLALGLLLDLYLVFHGLELGYSFGSGGLRPSTVVHGVITLRGLLTPLVILSVIAFLAALYPAVRAARMPPAVGMRAV